MNRWVSQISRKVRPAIVIIKISCKTKPLLSKVLTFLFHLHQNKKLLHSTQTSALICNAEKALEFQVPSENCKY